MYLNADLMESIQATPDTVITMVDGRKLVVAESADEVVDRIRDFRASILAAAEDFRSTGESGSLIVFPGKRTDDDEDES